MRSLPHFSKAGHSEVSLEFAGFNWTAGAAWKKNLVNLQKIKGPFSDAQCNGVHVTSLHWASEYGRLEVVLVSRTRGTNVKFEASISGFPVFALGLLCARRRCQLPGKT
jgi:hypothetical protein